MEGHREHNAARSGQQYDLEHIVCLRGLRDVTNHASEPVTAIAASTA